MNLVSLHHDQLHDGARILRLPPWVPPQGYGLYWHQPRSGEVRASGRVVLALWCGQVRYLDAAALTLTDDAPEDLRCGTCVGRRLGYDREGGAIFQPRDHFVLPRRCPSTDPDPLDYRLCVACGRRTNAARGWNSYGLAAHAPDPGLADLHSPCPRHGWSSLCVVWNRPTTLQCSKFRCSYVSERKDRRGDRVD